RETLFNWLQEDLPGAHCLDLFAGSGALGFEAASRQAAKVVMVEQNIKAVNALQQHRNNLAANTVDIIHQDALSWLKKINSTDNAFNIVFLDPPFASCLLGKALQALEEGEWFAPEALIYSESPVDQTLGNPFGPSWHLHRQRRFGAVNSRLYRRR
ncbi:MAG: 16S rRNA (guanine(966)-N(2))-methyltransferase RsmD, partial [Porticoccaceae bacterium]|nr:16S rRNA (guanine(966)-N(2))-methyltransferase RsmD [Porticoccaceae bacterium]